MLKVVLYCSSFERMETFYATGGVIHQELESGSGHKINFQGFGGSLMGHDADDFVRAASDADLVITDAWASPGTTYSDDPEQIMLDAVYKIQYANPSAIIVSQYMETDRLVKVHSVGKPFADWTGATVLCYLDLAWAIKSHQPGQDLAPILVVDDNVANQRHARQQLTGTGAIIVSSYLEAIALLDKYSFGQVLTDMMMPCEADTQGPKGMAFVGQESPMGAFVAIKAANRGIRVTVVSDTNHHNHPAARAAELVGGDLIAFNCPMIKVGEDSGYTKDWLVASQS
jgi:CheY-like chemotaxis protein